MKEITLKARDIKEHIIKDFGPLLIDAGFEYKKTNNEFSYTNGDYTYIFNILVISWSISYSITIRLWISQKQIEDIFETIIDKPRHRLTFNQDMIERIYYSPDGRKNGNGNDLTISLTKDEDVYPAIAILRDYYKNIAKPYFDRFKTLEAFDDFMNHPPFEYSPAYVGSYSNERCMKGLIVAKLVGNPDYKQLVAIYDELIKRTLSDVQPDSIINYNKVKEYLDNYQRKD